MNIDRTWWKEASVYQIYPRSFMDSNDDGIGDLKGIISKLDYIKHLGVDVIWISPFFKSPMDDNGYDISDYKSIHEEYGTLEDISNLIEGVHDRGMKLLVDLVVNHTSDEHPWFIESKKSKDNKYSDYYIWKDNPNNWESVFSGSAWEYDKSRNQYYLHVFSKKQPDLNWENEKVREEVYDIMNFWIDLGCDGFRMDVINLISKKFKDENYYGEEYFFNGPKIHDYLKEMNEKVLKGRNLMTVGECPGATVEDALKFAGNHNEELNMIFTFQHMDVDSNDGKWDFKEFKLTNLKEILSSWQKDLHNKAWNSLYLNNHDQPRMVSRFGDDTKYHNESAKMLGHVIHTMEGTPYIYQGEEIGMTNVDFKIPEEIKDLESLNAFNDLVKRGVFSKEHMIEAIKIKGRDNARTPMQWNDDKEAGFSNGKPWIKVNENYKDINVEKQINDKNSIFNFYRQLLGARKEYPVLIYGDFKEYLEDSEEVYIFRRKLGDSILYSINSFSHNEVELDLKNIGLNEDELKNLNSNSNLNYSILHSNYNRNNIDRTVILKPFECLSLISAD